MRKRAPRGMSSKTSEFCGVVLTGRGSYERRGSWITHDWATNDPNQIFRRENRDITTGHFCAVNIACQAAICEESPAGRLNTGQSSGNPVSR